MDPSSSMFSLRAVLLRPIQWIQVCLFCELGGIIPTSTFKVMFEVSAAVLTSHVLTHYLPLCCTSQAPANTFLFNSTEISFHLKVTFMKFPVEKHYFLSSIIFNIFTYIWECFQKEL